MVMTRPDLPGARRAAHNLCLALALAAASLDAGAAVKPLDRVAVVVENDIIMQSELEQRLDLVRLNLQKQGRPAPPAAQLRQAVTEQMIVESLQLQMAQRAGVRIPDAQLNEAMVRVADQNGMTLEAFREELDRQDLSYTDTREQIRREMTLQQVQQGVLRDEVKITDQEIASFLQSEAGAQATSTRYHIAHIMLPSEGDTGGADAAAQRALMERAARQTRAGKPLLEWLEDYNRQATTPLQGGDLGWRRTDELPAVFADAVPALKPGEVAGPIASAAGLHLVQLIEQRGGQQIIDQTHARHILIKVSEVRNDQQVQTLLKELRQRALGGENFGDLARQYSDDIGSAQEGGDLGWAGRGQFVPAFEQAMAETGINQISQPFQSQYGWHILQVLERRKYDVSDANAREHARRVLYQRKFQDELEVWLQKIRDEAYVDIKS